MEGIAPWMFASQFMEPLLVVEQTRYRHQQALSLAKDQPLPFQQKSIKKRSPLQKLRLLQKNAKNSLQFLTPNLQPTKIIHAIQHKIPRIRDSKPRPELLDNETHRKIARQRHKGNQQPR